MSASSTGCLYFRKPIGALRRLRDRQFCSPDHREKYSNSARAIREAEDLYGFDTQAVLEDREYKPDRRAGMGTTILVGIISLVCVLALSRYEGNSAGPKAVSALPDTNPHPNQGGFGQLLGNLIQSAAQAGLPITTTYNDKAQWAPRFPDVYVARALVHAARGADSHADEDRRQAERCFAC